MNEKIKVSIIVPIYNVQNYLGECLDSILNQTHKNIEIILINDGSTDDSSEIMKKYASKDNRIICINKENEGVSLTRNIGINYATGDYVCFSDADDILEKDYVDYLLNLIVMNNADISITTEMFTTFQRKQVLNDIVQILTAEEALISILTYKMPIGVYCKMFKRSFLGNNIRFISNIFIGEGFNFNTMAFQRANKVVVGHKKIYFYRRNNPTSATTDFKLEKWKNAIYAINNIHNDLIISNKKVENAWEYAFWHTHCDAFNFLVIAKKEKEYYKEYLEWKKVIVTKAFIVFKVSITFKEKLRGIIAMILPKLIPWLINKRNVKYIEKEGLTNENRN